MPAPNADEIITYKHKRNFIQFGGPGPTHIAQYAGQDAQYMSVEGVSDPESGGVDPIWVPDPIRIGSYRLVGRSISPPDLASASLMLREKHGAIPRQLQRIGCAFNLYEPTGKCKDLSDFLRGWSDYVLVYSQALVTDKDYGTRTSFDSDDPIVDSLSLTLADVYPIGALGFGEEAATLVDREVVDIVYGNSTTCGNCGVENDGTQWIYALATTSGAGSPGLPAEVIYTIDGGANWSESNITSFGATETPVAIEIVGQYLVVLGLDAYYYAEINANTGVPGTYTKISTGFVAAGSPVDIYVASAREVYFCGDGGYIYKATDITAGVSVISAGDQVATDLNRIHGVDSTIVIVGDSGVVLVSTNRGATFASATASPVAATLQALWVVSDNVWWIGTGAGELYYTLNGANTWTEKDFSGSNAGQVYDIVGAGADVLFFSHSTADPTARVFSSWNGGADFTNASPRILNLPVFDRATRLALPQAAHISIAANNLAVGGLAGDGSDGLILLGIASRL